MKSLLKYIAGGIAGLVLALSVAAIAQTPPQQLPNTGPQLVPGSYINYLLNAVSGAQNGTYKGTFTGIGTFTGQLRTTYGTPTIASGNCGTGANGVITSGTNQAGLVTIGAASTTTCQIDFSATLAAAPNACILFPASAGAAATGTTVARVSSITTASFVITGSALATTAYYWLCI